MKIILICLIILCGIGLVKEIAEKLHSSRTQSAPPPYKFDIIKAESVPAVRGIAEAREKIIKHDITCKEIEGICDKFNRYICDEGSRPYKTYVRKRDVDPALFVSKMNQIFRDGGYEIEIEDDIETGYLEVEIEWGRIDGLE